MCPERDARRQDPVTDSPRQPAKGDERGLAAGPWDGEDKQCDEVGEEEQEQPMNRDCERQIFSREQSVFYRVDLREWRETL
ncbi:hypothetical protein PVAP13_7NG138134 [Panicum virgatum]|uniref:Uncharacterized protein n=1 Tax=Panicum virgatum TaxID=38727 RepID=A0A8T0PTI1_PANVG|nr:hypothetical protein PVAP13_7NG138134 [Panicum virgatum]